MNHVAAANIAGRELPVANTGESATAMLRVDWLGLGMGTGTHYPLSASGGYNAAVPPLAWHEMAEELPVVRHMVRPIRQRVIQPLRHKAEIAKDITSAVCTDIKTEHSREKWQALGQMAATEAAGNLKLPTAVMAKAAVAAWLLVDTPAVAPFAAAGSAVTVSAAWVWLAARNLDNGLEQLPTTFQVARKHYGGDALVDVRPMRKLPELHSATLARSAPKRMANRLQSGFIVNNCLPIYLVAARLQDQTSKQRRELYSRRLPVNVAMYMGLVTLTGTTTAIIAGKEEFIQTNVQQNHKLIPLLIGLVALQAGAKSLFRICKRGGQKLATSEGRAAVMRRLKPAPHNR